MDNVTAQEVRNRCHSEITEQAFRAMPEKDLIRCIDAFAHTGGGHKRALADFRNELTRRETERQGKRLEWLTWAIVGLTVTLVVLELLPRISGAGH